MYVIFQIGLDTEQPEQVIIKNNNQFTVIELYLSYCFNFSITGDGAYYVNDIDPNLCTHLIYGFAVLNSTTFHIQIYDQWADIDTGGYSKFVALKSKNPKLKTMIAVGGWTDSLDGKYSDLVSDIKRIVDFVDSVMEFLQLYRFDGLDLDWEYPETPEDKIGFANLITALRKEFKPMGYLLSAAVVCNVEKTDAGIVY